MIRAVSIGTRTVRIPVCRISKTPGPSILITAGMDGDEYASMDAAYRLVELLRNRLTAGTATIIPVVNIPGFEDVRSFNPLDSLYPKLIFPGKPSGKPSERLISWLDTNYIHSSSVWIDLHGGGVTERILPYIYTYQSGNPLMNQKIESVLDSLPVSRAVYRDLGAWKKTDQLAKRGIAYYFLEAGCSGERRKEDIALLIHSVFRILHVYGMADVYRDSSRPGIGKKRPRVYRKTSSYRTKYTGLWYPAFSPDGNVKKGDSLGEVRSMDQKRLGTLKAGEDGEWLWYVERLFVRAGDYLCEIAHGRENG